ncbi:MAG TPA: hypothetical protein P5248_00925 [Bacteroidales bacterium]|nr:hypothetical protein [Bacteroidales bacterium]
MLHALPELIPGVEKAMLVFASDHDPGLSAFRIDFGQPGTGHERMETGSLEEELHRLRQTASGFDWLEEGELPFSSRIHRSPQIDIFSALQKNVLCVCLPNPLDGLNDLLYIHLSGLVEKEGVKGIRRGMDPFSREFVGQMITMSLRYFLGNNLRQDDRRDRFMQQTRDSFRQFTREREQYRRTGQRYGESLLKLAEARLEDLERRHGSMLRLSEGACEAIRNYPGDLTQLLQRLDQAAEYALELYRGSQEPEQIIEDWFMEILPMEQPDDQAAEQQESAVKGALSRTIELLDKLEDAARKAEQSSRKLTSANVGRLCPTPISAPAISDSIRNHRDRIISLLSRHPERWPLIRRRFRPITNILENNASGIEQESA